MFEQFSPAPDRRTVLKGLLAVGGGAALVGPLAACGSGTATGQAAKVGLSIDEIAAMAKQEGGLQLIACPPTWANYKGHFAAFEAKYGVKITVANPDGSSADELQAVKSLKGQKTQPDVLDIGYSFTDTARSQRLIEQYKPANFAAIPENLKDPDGWWVGAYYGVIAIGVNTKVIETSPTSFADLLEPEFKGKIMLAGDPRKVASSYAAVVAAALANGGSPDNITPGIEYFAKLKRSGNLISATSIASAMATGEAAVALDWNYNWVGATADMAKAGVKIAQTVPTDGVFGTYYAQPMTVSPARPNAARLWVEWLTSDEGSEQFALGGAIPARFAQLSAAGKLSKEALAQVPDEKVAKAITFPTIEQGAAGSKVLVDQWGPKVLDA